MKAIKLLAMIFVASFIASVCAAAPTEMPAKYNLDNQLERVSEISKYSLISWEKVDNQSFVLQTSPSDYYLIVLSNRCDRLLFSESIKITDTMGSVRPGFENVIVRGNGFSGTSETCIIDKIYKFKDSKQVKEIEAQLSGKTK